MGKDKLKRFAENLTFGNMIQPPFPEVFRRDSPLKGRWGIDHFHNPYPITLELGCGRGEYTLALALQEAKRNVIGVDIKGARMWRGAKSASEMGLPNAAFLRTRIEVIDSFFAPGEVDEIWITFPDPQLRRNRIRKRLTHPLFLERYRSFLAPHGVIHLKTDSRHLHDYTLAVARHNGWPVAVASADLYGEGLHRTDPRLGVQTAYERRFLEQGARITYLCIHPAAGPLESPDFEGDRYLG